MNNLTTLEYNILRGQDKIGENLIEVLFGDTKILVELGKSLEGIALSGLRKPSSPPLRHQKRRSPCLFSVANQA